MSDTNEATTVATAAPAKPAKARAKRPIKKAAKAKAAAAPSTNGTPRVKMIKPWRQVLTVLARTNGALTRKKVAEKVQSMLKDSLINNRVSQESKTYAALAEAKLIKVQTLDIDGKAEEVNSITAAGKKALADAKK